MRSCVRRGNGAGEVVGIEDEYAGDKADGRQ
jgi:hypothetical protein